MTTKKIEAEKTGKCYCGCEGATANYFAPGHDLGALKNFVKTEYGSVANLLASYGYTPGSKTLKDARAAIAKDELERDYKKEQRKANRERANKTPVPDAPKSAPKLATITVKPATKKAVKVAKKSSKKPAKKASRK